MGHHIANAFVQYRSELAGRVNEIHQEGVYVWREEEANRFDSAYPKGPRFEGGTTRKLSYQFDPSPAVYGRHGTVTNGRGTYDPVVPVYANEDATVKRAKCVIELEGAEVDKLRAGGGDRWATVYPLIRAQLGTNIDLESIEYTFPAARAWKARATDGKTIIRYQVHAVTEWNAKPVGTAHDTQAQARQAALDYAKSLGDDAPFLRLEVRPVISRDTGEAAVVVIERPATEGKVKVKVAVDVHTIKTGATPVGWQVYFDYHS